MDPFNNMNATAQELISFAQERGINLERCRAGGNFEQGLRSIFLWRKDELPYSGPADEPLGTLHYNMQGTIAALPGSFGRSDSSFRGAWSEAGTFENLGQALDLVKAWLLDLKEVDELPDRIVKRCGI